MTRRLTWTLVVALAAVTPLSLGAVPIQDSASVDGDWSMQMETPQGNMDVSMTLETKDGKLAGTLHGPQGDAPLTGSLDGKALKLELSVDTPQGQMTIDFTGDVDGDTISNGSANLGDFGTMAWSAKRTPKQ
jgi:autotransporter translocation and assembly factor TamB